MALVAVAAACGVRMLASYWLVGGVLGFGSTTALRFSWRLIRSVATSAAC